MNNLEKIRGKHELTLTELASKTGFTKQSLFYSEKFRITYKKAQKIADVLNENVFDILGEDAFVSLPKTEKERETLIKTLLDLDLLKGN